MNRLKPEISLDVSPDFSTGQNKELDEWIREYRVDEVECVTPDLAGVARGKVMPAMKFIREEDVRMPVSILLATVTGDYPEFSTEIREYDIDADVILVPDISTARAVPWANDPSIQIIHDAFDEKGNPISFTSRNVLRRVLKLYEDKGWRPVISPEIEFYLTKPNTNPENPLEPPIGRSGRQSHSKQAYSLSAVDEFDRVIEHIYDYAEAQSLNIDTILHESGAAQLEINLQHGDPLKLADEVFLYKRLIREAALQCGCYATFMAKPMGNQPGSAMHIHQSVVDIKTGKNIFSNRHGNATPEFKHFIGGQQKYLADAAVLMAPYVNSYRRLVPEMSAPVNLDWGHDNRSVGLRAPRAKPEARRVENRLVGADANPYLAIAASLACGYLGMIEEVKPRKEVTTEVLIRGRDLPTGLLDAALALDSSKELRKVLGDLFVDVFVGVKRKEHEDFMLVISPWEREHLLLNV